MAHLRHCGFTVCKLKVLRFILGLPVTHTRVQLSRRTSPHIPVMSSHYLFSAIPLLISSWCLWIHLVDWSWTLSTHRPTATLMGQLQVNTRRPTATLMGQLQVNMHRPTATLMGQLQVNTHRPTATLMGQLQVPVETVFEIHFHRTRCWVQHSASHLVWMNLQSWVAIRYFCWLICQSFTSSCYT